MKHKLKYMMIPTASASLMILGGCGDDENVTNKGNKADLLEGEWELFSIDGEVQTEYYEDYIGRFSLIFEGDGDLRSCYIYDYPDRADQRDCYDIGTWEWVNPGEELDFSFSQGGGFDYRDIDKFQISAISEDEMKGTWVDIDDGDEMSVSFRRMD